MYTYYWNFVSGPVIRITFPVVHVATVGWRLPWRLKSVGKKAFSPIAMFSMQKSNTNVYCKSIQCIDCTKVKFVHIPQRRKRTFSVQFFRSQLIRLPRACCFTSPPKGAFQLAVFLFLSALHQKFTKSCLETFLLQKSFSPHTADRFTGSPVNNEDDGQPARAACSQGK